MQPTQQQPKPAPGSLLYEIEAARKRAGRNKKFDPRQEFTGTLYPLLQMMSMAFGKELGDHEARLMQAEIAITELAIVGESVVLPDLAAQIGDALGIGSALATAVLMFTDGDDRPVAEDLRELSARYENAANAAREAVAGVLVADDDDDDDDSEFYDDDDGRSDDHADADVDRAGSVRTTATTTAGSGTRAGDRGGPAAAGSGQASAQDDAQAEGPARGA